MEDRIRSRNLNFLSHDFEALHDRREQFAVELRKEKRSKKICKKRDKSNIIANRDHLDCLLLFPSDILQYLPTEFEYLPMINQLKLISEALEKQIPDQIKEIMIEKVDNFVRENKLDVKSLYDVGFAQSLMSLLHSKASKNIIIISMHILGCILDSNDEYKLEIFSNGLFDKIITFVCPGDAKVLDYAIWVLANISDEKTIAVFLLKYDILKCLLKLYNDISSWINSDIVESFGMLLSNITMHYKEISKEDAKFICQIVVMVMENKEFDKSEFIRTLNHLCRNNSLIEIAIASKAIEYALEEIEIPENTEIVFELLGIISSGNSIQAEYIFQHNILDTCYNYINCDSKSILKNIMIIINNIISESTDYIPLIILHDIFPCIQAKLLYNAEKVRLEASFVLLAIMTKTKNTQTLYVINSKLHIYLQQALKFDEPEFLQNCLIISFEIFKFLYLYPDFIELDIRQFLLVIGDLVTHKNKDVSNLAEEILSLYTNF
ncbi:hypothetical protein SteCoe_29790 [Stentor coeruleus]|uniref:IBB domain-containing protein n=1 Tax=Stentor coeruleus TaxID=5963 RepID=A0A1R2B551_9CILI|nr:hypothetical protein SteCoe_29790 [Stentor coeruleus]